ncbi:MAG: hypothetical protein ABJH50_09305, partial [Marinomonas sp.]
MPIHARVSQAAIAACALSLFAPIAASAKNQCPAVKAITSGDLAELDGVATRYNASGRIDVTKHGVSGALQNADGCELSSRQDMFELDCVWKFSAAEQNSAEKQFDALLERLDSCLPSALIAQKPVQYGNAIEPLREYE